MQELDSRLWRQIAAAYDRHRWLTAYAVLFTIYVVVGAMAQSAATEDLEWPGLALCVIAVGALVVLPILPAVSGLALALVWIVPWCVGLTPPLVLGATMLFGVAMLSWRKWGLGFVLTAVAWVAAWTSGRLAVEHLVILMGVLGTAFAVGLSLGWRDESHHSEEQLQKSRETLRKHLDREDLAADIHDSISNKLVFLVMAFERHQNEGTPIELKEIEPMRQAASIAYEHSHEVIHALTGSASRPSPTGDAQVGQMGQQRVRATAQPDSNWLSTVATRLEQGDGRLNRLGFDGSGVPPHAGHRGQPSQEVLEELLSLIDETYANIAKHADPAHPYIVSVAANADGIVLSCADTAAAKPSGGLASHVPGGNGLTRHRRHCVELGGSLDVTESGDAWTLTAALPYH